MYLPPTDVFKRVFCVLLLTSVFASTFSALAQTRRGSAQAIASNRSGTAAKCSGAWTGSITYKRAQSMTNNKTVSRVSGRGQDTTTFEMKYEYDARVSVVESPERNGSSLGKGNVTHFMTSSETTEATESNSCDRGKTWQSMSGKFTSKTETTGTESVDANVTVGVNADGTYLVSIGLPQIRGKTAGSQSSSFSGQCTAKEGKTLNHPPTETTIEGNSLTSDGSHRINPSDPNRLSGTYSQTWQNVTETITWNLQKCGAPLRIIDLKFEDMKFPNWNDWQEIVEQKGTTDGNLVKIKAKVLNASGESKFADLKFKETYKGDKWDGSRPDGLLENGEASIRLEPGEEREVEVVWDSSGYAWFDDGRPRLVQRIKAELEENSKKIDEMTKNLKVAPKPLVLVHGLWSSWKAWEPWQNLLTTSHSYDWKAFPVGEKTEKGVMNTGGEFLSTSRTNSIFENSQQLGKYIWFAQEDRNAWHVDVVAHSMGGLITRHYIHQFMPPNPQDGRPQIAHLVMLGTPNMGSPCADIMNTAFELLGKDVEAVRQLRQDVTADFNRVHTNRKGVKFSVLAGDPLPTMCKSLVWNDGVVPVPSAIWQIKDHAKSKNVHTELTGTADFSSFVKPRLAIGPKGNHNPEAPTLPQASITALSATPGSLDVLNDDGWITTEHRRAGASFVSVGIFDSSIDARHPQTFAKGVIVPRRQAVEIEIPALEASNFGLTFMAGSDISATLIDDTGAIAGKNSARSPAANSWFRSIFVDRPVISGTWRLKLENLSDRELEVVITTWTAALK